MQSVWNPHFPEGKPQNSLAAKGFRSVRPKFLTPSRKSPVQPSINNGMVEIRKNNQNARSKEACFSAISQSNIPCGTETEDLPSAFGPNLNVPCISESESQPTSVSPSCKVLRNTNIDNSASSADHRQLGGTKTEGLQITEIDSLGIDVDSVYKNNLRTVSEKMNIRSSSNALLTSEKKRSPPLIAKKVLVEDEPKTWYKSMFKDDYNALRADKSGVSPIVDARKKTWEPNSSFSSTTGYPSRSQLTGPLPYNSSTRNNCTIKQALSSEPLSSSNDNLHDSWDWNLKNYATPASDYPATKSTEVPCNLLAAKELHSLCSTEATAEECNRSHPNTKVDTCGYHVEPKSVFDYKPGKSSILDHDHSRPRHSNTSGAAFLSKSRSLPMLAESAGQLTINETRQCNGSDIDLPQLKFMEIQRYSSADQISINSENGELPLADAPKPSDQHFQSQKPKVPEETRDQRQQLKMELTVRAKYDFHGQTSKELPVRKGDIIFIHRQKDHNWYEGQCNGKSGLIPICYVESASDPQRDEQKALDEIAIARFRFAALTNIELPLEKNQSVVLLRRIDENWYEGKYPGTNRKGIFPVTYVEVIGKSTDVPVFHQHLPTSENDLKIKMTSQRPFQQLQQRSMNNENIQSGEEIYLALYSFSPNKEDELEVKQGDIINVVKKCGDGWYFGTSRRTKKFGTFPGNYVEKLCL
ncbi:vinexin-like isoform X3 [Chiloscyllium plagiosum]|uniref:vinexin-like isoform X3 n=1 Tax=Chiloscyllium plagiosum TaxID=36176 RepID=UPI001CB85569|nr:vinexin-like isoform X3 [Chiloscyllium plagiosum]